MELGAVVCTAKNPLCDHCPVRDDCAFLAAGRPGLGERRTRPRQRFQGTDRQVRGIVLDALRRAAAAPDGSGAADGVLSSDGAAGGVAAGGVAAGGGAFGSGGTVLERASVEALWRDRAQLDRCVASLDEDGLIEILPGGAIRLPLG